MREVNKKFKMTFSKHSFSFHIFRVIDLEIKCITEEIFILKLPFFKRLSLALKGNELTHYIKTKCSRFILLEEM